jgi:hypothetical protein
MADILKNTRSEPSLRRGGMSFEEIFGPGKQAKPTRISPMAAKWIKAFEDSAAAVLCARNIPRLEAERVAFANTVAAFLDANRPATDPSRCVQCGLSERPNDLRPLGGGDRHSWVHIDCWKAWSEHGRVRAIEALAAMGIVSP